MGKEAKPLVLRLADEREELRAQLASLTKERDELREAIVKVSHSLELQAHANGYAKEWNHARDCETWCRNLRAALSRQPEGK